MEHPTFAKQHARREHAYHPNDPKEVLVGVKRVALFPQRGVELKSQVGCKTYR